MKLKAGEIYKHGHMEEPIKEKSEAASILLEAASIVDGARSSTHGEKERCFEDIAKLWSCYKKVDISAKDVCIMMTMLKIGRIMNGQPVMDHFVDSCGYMSIAYEVSNGKR